MAAGFLSSASSLFGGLRSTILANYSTTSGPSTPGGSPSLSSASATQIGLWSVTPARANSTGKACSIWTFAKDRDKSGSGRVIEIAKRDASMLSRLRHPTILEVVEPVEDTRAALIFVTEAVQGSLREAVGGRGSRRDVDSELDEVEIQRGLLQVAQALQFLHEQARLVHGNVTPASIIRNAKGDWKLGGFGVAATYLQQPDGTPARYVFPEHDPRMPDAAQRDFDYLAPEYAIDEQLLVANDMYSLGAVLLAIHAKSGPPFSNRNQISRLRQNIEQLPVLRAQWSRLGDDVQAVLSQLLTRYPSERMTASGFQSSRFFSSVLVATLRFLDRDTFSAKGRDEQASFMRGLHKMLPQFSDKLLKRKILPSLLEQTRLHYLLPFVLPNIFYIADKMGQDEFARELLPSLKPLFLVRDPPQHLLSMLDHMHVFEAKCSAQTFREEALPLLYAALESDQPVVLERALRLVPELAKSLDYSTVKDVLFPKLAQLFTKTTMLSVKVNSLICFHALCPTLDKYTLTEKLVPMLSRIRSKEPSVMISCLAVCEAIGEKVDVAALATLVLPQLWQMSVTPLLNVGQFARFMDTIEKLARRVKAEHSAHLAEVSRLEESANVGGASKRPPGVDASGQVVDFEALVRGGAGAATSAGQTTVAPDPWDMLGGAEDGNNGPALFVPAATNGDAFASRSSTPGLSVGRASTSSASSIAAPRQASYTSPASIVAPTSKLTLGARPMPQSSFSTSAFPAPPRASPVVSPTPSMGALPPPMSFASQPLQASTSSSVSTIGKPNYSILLPQQAPKNSPSAFSMPTAPTVAPMPGWPSPQLTAAAAPPGFDGGILQPSRAPKPPSLGNWGELDPLG